MIQKLTIADANKFFNRRIRAYAPDGCDVYRAGANIIIDVPKDGNGIYTCLLILDWVRYARKMNYTPSVSSNELKTALEDFSKGKEKQFPIEVYSDMRRVAVQIVNHTGEYYSGLFTYPKIPGVSLVQTQFGWCVRFVDP